MPPIPQPSIAPNSGVLLGTWTVKRAGSEMPIKAENEQVRPAERMPGSLILSDAPKGRRGRRRGYGRRNRGDSRAQGSDIGDLDRRGRLVHAEQNDQRHEEAKRKPANGPKVSNSQTMPFARPIPHQAPMGARTARLSGMTIMSDSAGTTTSLNRWG